MSWLYTVIFGGLIFSYGNDLPMASENFTDSNVQAVVRQDETERFEKTYPLNSNGRVSVSNVNGSITLETWDKNEVKLEYVKTADNRERLSEVEIRIEARQDSFSVETNFDKWKRSDGKWNKNNRFDIQYRLIVPRNAILDEIETVNGSVSITGAGNSTKASAVNGQVRATNLRGTANLSTVNGTVEADFERLQAVRRISLNTVNGTVNLTIPSNANATVKADTLNGSITNDFGLPVRKGEYVGRDLYGKIGSGDVQIRLNSVNGALSIKRKNDGRNVNPATNLLNLKRENDDEDWDDENNSKVKPPKPPRPPRPPRPPKPPALITGDELDGEMIRKSIEEGLKQSEKEIEKIGPVLEREYAEAIKQAKNISSEEIKAQIRQAQEKYKEALTRMSEANWTIGSPNIETKKESFSVKGTPRVTVEARNCDVSVRGWDKSEVGYSMARISRNFKKPTERNTSISINNTDSTVDIKVSAETKLPGGAVFEDGTKMRIEVFVPKKSNLKIVTDGEIRLEDVSGTIDLRGADETINVREGDGQLTINGKDARIRVIGFRGELESRTTGGSMFLDGGLQRLLAETSDGEIILNLPENENAIIGSNKEINAEDINLNEAGDKKWRVGKGGANYFLRSADGEIFVRSMSVMKIN